MECPACGKSVSGGSDSMYQAYCDECLGANKLKTKYGMNASPIFGGGYPLHHDPVGYEIALKKREAAGKI